MVIRIFALLGALLTPLALLAQKPIEVIAEVNSATTGENQPIEVVLRVVRDEGLKVDESSVQVEGKSYALELLQNTRQSSVTIINGRRQEEHLLISSYRFFVPGKPKGLYMLPAVSVVVGGKRMESRPVSYEILASEESRLFRISAFVEGVMPLYPGQRAKFIYRIYFKDNIEVTYEDLPLMEAEGFKRVGEKQFRKFTRGDQQVTEVTQEVEAISPGEYVFGPSVVEGFAYRDNFLGRKVYQKPRLRASADPVTVEVASFPSKGKPGDFSGIIGRYALRARLRTPAQLIVGDKIELEVTFAGTGEWSTVQLPDLSQREPFKGKFRFSDLPPVSQSGGKDEKSYVVELRPLSPDVSAIPSITVPIFDPIARSYTTISSDPIPLQVEEARRPSQYVLSPPSPPEKSKEEEEPVEKVADIKKGPLPLLAVEIAGNYVLSTQDLQVPWYGTWRTLWLMPLALLMLGLQWGLKRQWKRGRERPSVITSRELMEQAKGDQTLALFEKGLLLRLHELGKVERVPFSGSELSEEGIEGEVRGFLLYLEECRFGGPSSYSEKEVAARAWELYGRMV